LHPFVIGVPHRIAALNSSVAYIPHYKGVWRATGSEIIERDVLSGVAAGTGQQATGLRRQLAHRGHERIQSLVRQHVIGAIVQRTFNPRGCPDRRKAAPGSGVREGGDSWLKKTFASA
jgi:hypothetical protein